VGGSLRYFVILARAIIYLTHLAIPYTRFMSSTKAPETLLEAVTYFADPDRALAFMVSLRWPNGVTCPECSGTHVSFLETRRMWKCLTKECKKQFSVKVGTVFEASPIALEKWLPCLWMLVNCKNGISSYEVHRALGVTQKTAWFMLHRLRLAMQAESFGKFGGSVEADETFIGGKARNMHAEKRKRVIKGQRGMVGKVAVFGLLERHARKGSRVKLEVIPDREASTLHVKVKAHVKQGANLYTDSASGYRGLEEAFIHGVIDHGEKYVDGLIHTNGLENFWSLLKRTIRGTYVAVEPFHLFRYLDEQGFRFNNRSDDDQGRFMEVLANVVGRRLTYRTLTGKNLL